MHSQGQEKGEAASSMVAGGYAISDSKDKCPGILCHHLGWKGGLDLSLGRGETGLCAVTRPDCSFLEGWK